MIPNKTKIICTMGPATSSVEKIIELANAGMNIARVNFSHGNYESHKEIIQNIRKAEELSGKTITILGDLQGPKIRIDRIEGGQCELVKGQEFVITSDEIGLGNSEMVSTNFAGLISDAKGGKEILLDDGYIILDIVSVEGTKIKTKVRKGGTLKDRKGIIIPGCSSSAPSITEKDLKDLKFAIENDIDVVAMSFVRNANDIIELRGAMKIYGSKLPIVSKIERVEAVNNLNNIVKEVDIIMIARGDLGLEMPAELVPLTQKEIIDRCNFYGKPVIVATQMLESMIKNPRPTRAEASDVANAVLDGADVLMLSGETSVGDYPIEAVEYMSKIISSVEMKYCTIDFESDTPKERLRDWSDALANSSCVLARQVGASAIISITGTGYTASNISKYRPCIPIIAITDSIQTKRFLNFTWGVQSVSVPKIDNRLDIYQNIGNILGELSYIQKGDNVVFVAGLSSDEIIPQNIIKIYQI
jgi:pyruvate kinase